MTARTSLALVIHFHQPVGNLDRVVRKATERCYRPFLEVLDQYPEVPLTLHYSGCLLEWFEENDRGLALKLREMVDRGQVELLTGGFYEPVLAALPERDRVGQIRMLTDHLRKEYLAIAKGGWLTERVWEQDVVGSLTEAGVEYTVLDDTMFHGVGITDEELTGPFVTEHDGRPLLVFAGDRNLRYLIPYKKVTKVTDHLRSAKPGRLFVYADDGEKFGEWPDTHERVYGKGWLHDFFEELRSHSEWLTLVRLGDYAATAVPQGRVYLPSSSYDEMMTWALPTEARLTLGKARRKLQQADPDGALPYLRGAPWRAFLAKYPEVNHLQKRMLTVSKQVEEAGDPEVARRELYRAQCNCAYWHGAFGGLYLGFMRGALWHHLMRAEGAVSRADGPAVRAIDINADTLDEILITAPWGAAVVSPHQGGALIELDDWRNGANVLATVSRRREAYHLEDENPPEEVDDDEMQPTQPKSEVDRDTLVFDDYERGGLVDLVDGERVSERYDFQIDNGGRALLWTGVNGLKIEKALSADSEELIVNYTVSNHSGRRYDGTFGIQSTVMPLNLGRETKPDEVEIDEMRWSVAQTDGEVNVEVGLGLPGKTLATPVETAATSLEGLVPLLQGTEITTTWDLGLDAGESLSIEMRWRLIVNEAALTKTERGVSARV